MVKYLGKTEHDLDLVTKSYLVQQLSNVTDDSALASALSSYIKSSDANNLVSELGSEVEEKLRAKVAKVDGKTLSANDFTNEFRQKLENSYTNEQIEQKIREATQNIDLSQYARADHTHTSFDNLSIGNKLAFGDFGMQYEGGEYPSLTWSHSEAGNILSARKFFVDFWKNFDIHGNEIKGLATPTRDDHAASKGYVDNKVANISLPDSGMTQEQADGRYSRIDHTHTSSDISDSITRIGTVASANKLIKTDSDGFIDFIAPSDSSPDKTVILKGYLDTKLGQKANSDHNHDSTYYQKTEYISDPGASDKANKPLKSNASGGLTLTNTPTENTDVVNKLYVDNKVANISLPDSGMTQSQADQRYLRSNAATSTLGRHLTVDASNDGNYSASLFLKKNSHHYEFYTNAAGKFGAWDKTNERNLFSADRNSFRHDTNVDMGSNRITSLPEPNGDNQPATKRYVDNAVRSGQSDTSSFIQQSDIDPNPESPTGNKLVRRKGDGAIVVPTTGTERRVAISRGEVDDKLNAKADSNHNHNDTYYQKNEYVDTVDASTRNKPVKTDGTGNINITPIPSANSHVANKQYVDRQVNTVLEGIPGALGAAGFISQADADRRYHQKSEHIDTLDTDSANKPIKADSNGYISMRLTPTHNNHLVNKSYVDNKVANIDASSSGMTQAQADERYARRDHLHNFADITGALSQEMGDERYSRTNHTHVSADITDTITAIGTINSANKIVKTDSTGFLNIVAPTDSSPGKSIVLKSYLDEKLGQKADSNHTHTGYLSESDVTIDIGGNNATSKVVKTGTDGQLNITTDPTSDNHVVRKSYVDRKVREAGSSGRTVNGITQSTADSRYARASHTHDSADITNTTNRIGTSASANKVVKLDSSGFLDIVTPNDNSPGNSVIVKSYMESKLNEKASASELETLRNTITQLQNKIQTLEANAGKVKNSATNRYLDVWVGPENQKPSDSTDKLVFVEKE